MVLNAIWTTRLAWVMSLTRPEIRAEGWRRSTSPHGQVEESCAQSSLRARSVTRALPYPPVRLMSMLSRGVEYVHQRIADDDPRCTIRPC